MHPRFWQHWLAVLSRRKRPWPAGVERVPFRRRSLAEVLRHPPEFEPAPPDRSRAGEA